MNTLFHNSIIDVEKMYHFDFTHFTGEQWGKLSAVYESLPSFEGVLDNGCPQWFGTNEYNPPVLWAVVEPEGLNVLGTLHSTLWNKWDRQFSEMTSFLPRLHNDTNCFYKIV